jgi:threonyl-tRNA synthetase
MIHRAVLGSFERFIGILIEHYAANFPLWLSPQHARVLPISEKTNDYALKVLHMLKDARLRCDADLSDEKVNAKIAKAHAEKIPYMLVVGPKEADAATVNVRTRGLKQNKTVAVDRFIQLAKQKIIDKTIDLDFQP